MRPRLLRIITRLNVGGPATHVVLADRGLNELGWETLLVHGQVEPDEAEIDVAGTGIRTRRAPDLIRPVRPSADARALVELVSIIRRYRPHLIHTHLSKAGLVGRSAGIIASRAPRVHTFHGTVFGGYFGERTSGAIALTERFLARRTDRVIALSTRQRDELLAYGIGPADRIRIVALGLDLGRFKLGDRESARRGLGIDPADILVVAVGRMVPIKRLDRLVRAFSDLHRAVPAARLALVGDGSERARLEQEVRACDLQGSVRFVGWSADTPLWYAAADVVALTSAREGTPLALIEAAAAGRPVVAVDVGGVSDIVADGETGFVVPADDDASLAARLHTLATDPSLRDRMGRAAPQHAAAFDQRRLVEDLDRLYRELLRGRA